MDSGIGQRQITRNIPPQIDELNRLREASRELESAIEFYEDQLDHTERLAHLGSWNYDLGLNEIWWSEEMCRIFGFDRGQGLSFQQFIDRVHPDDQGVWLRVVEALSSEGTPYVVRFRAMSPNGNYQSLIGRGMADFGEDGGVWRIFGTVQLVSAALQGTGAKATASGTFPAAVEHPPEPAAILAQADDLNNTDSLHASLASDAELGFWELDLTSGDIVWSPQMYLLHDVNAESFKPSLEEMLSFYDQQDVTVFEDALQSSVENRTGFMLSTTLTTDSNQVRRIHVSAKLLGETPDQYKLVGTVQDVTGWSA